MRVRWTAPAAQDLYSIVRYIRRENPTAARDVAKKIFDGCESLAQSPFRGRPGQQTDTRELIISSLPYVAVYRVAEDVVEILHIWHGAQSRR